MWWFRWHSRRIFRSLMNPIPEERARVWTRRLRWFYIFCGWNAFLIGLKFYRENRPKLQQMGLIHDLTTTHRKARLLDTGDMTLIRMGFNKPTEVYEFNAEQYNQQFKEKQRLAQNKLKQLKQENNRLKNEEKQKKTQ